MEYSALHIGPEEKLRLYRYEAEQELQSILKWWMKNLPDEEGGGFYGEIDARNIIQKRAPRGLVLNSRILWTFSAAYLHTGNKEYLLFADRAFSYIKTFFLDPVYGGMYWSVDYKGQIHQDKKQVYGIAFCIYGFTEYYLATGDEQSLELAIELFQLLEKYSYDPEHGGYFEAFSRNWDSIADLRLSEKDANEKKTMNTHLHILEAYTNLYKVWQTDSLADAINSLLKTFQKNIISPQSHQHLFFSETLEVRSKIISYGHDIEASWLLFEASELLGNKSNKLFFENNAVEMANAALSGVDKDGGMWYEYDSVSRHYNKEKHWWPQAEAMVGFFNAYQVSGNSIYLQHSQNSWDYIKNNILDRVNGEWYWGLKEDGSAMDKEKAGFWKCPYHNSRACMEISKRISTMQKQSTG